MTAKNSRSIAILNTSGPLAPKLDSYFKRKGFLVVDSTSSDLKHEWTHILTKDLQDFSNIELNYNTFENDIKIISLTPVHQPKSFTSANGKLVYDPLWLRSPIGLFILDKFFQEFGGVTPEENYPSFKEIGSFNIVNPFSTGEFLDRLVFHAFEAGMKGLSIKTYFDHLVMFLAGLKATGKLGWPIEVTYGEFEGVFGLQLHFFSNSLHMKEFISCLGEIKSRKTEEYLLNVSVQAADFFDVTYLSDVKKMVITGLWTNDQWMSFENRGMMFTELTSKASLSSYPTSGFKTNLLEVVPMDLSSKINLPKINEAPLAIQVISGKVTEKELVQNLKGLKAEKEETQVVSGNFDEEETSETIKGSVDPKDNFKVSVSGKMEEDKSTQIIKGEGTSQHTGSFNLKESESAINGKKSDKFTIKAGDVLPKKPGFNNKIGEATADAAKKAFDFLELKQLNNTKEKDSGVDAFVKHLDVAPKQETFTSPLIQTELETKAKTLAVENEVLKRNIKKLITEVKITKEAKSKLAEITLKATQSIDITDENKKIQMEIVQKEILFIQELERAERQIKSKEILIEKNRDMANNAIEKKNDEILQLQIKTDQLNTMLAGHHPQKLTNHINLLERETENQNKMIEMYKEKIAVLTANMDKQIIKGDEDNVKEENRKLQMAIIQNKNQLDIVQKELARYQEKSEEDNTVIAALKSEKFKTDQMLKKASFESKKTAETGVSKIQHDIEVKRLTVELTRMEHVLKESQKRAMEMEVKLQDALKAKAGSGNGDEMSKGKVLQLETSLKKLTQDLMENRHQMGDLKKEANKLRQEKTALQNQMDRMKKELEKTGNKAPKLGGSSGSNGGKAA